MLLDDLHWVGVFLAMLPKGVVTTMLYLLAFMGFANVFTAVTTTKDAWWYQVLNYLALNVGKSRS